MNQQRLALRRQKMYSFILKRIKDHLNFAFSILWRLKKSLVKFCMQQCLNSIIVRLTLLLSYLVRPLFRLHACFWNTYNLGINVVNLSLSLYLKIDFILGNDGVYNLRGSNVNVILPKPKPNFLMKSFKFSGAKLWNSLPLNTKLQNTLLSFKRHLP